MAKFCKGVELGPPILVDFLRASPAVSSAWLLLLGVGPIVREGAEAVPATAPVSTKTAVSTLAAPRADANRGAGFQVLTVTVDRDGEENIVLPPREAQAGYPFRMNNAVYLKDMKPSHLP